MKAKKFKLTKMQKGFCNSLENLISIEEHRTIYQQLGRNGRDTTYQYWKHFCKICNQYLGDDQDYNKLEQETVWEEYSPHFVNCHQITNKETADKYARMLMFA